MRPDILTAAGRYFDFEHPERCEFGIEEIAHALSHICRFTGHTKQFYSVAQHSVLVSYLVPPEDALAGLLHDAAEAFIGDVAKPLKQLLPDYQGIEARVERAVLFRFGLPAPLPVTVKHADLQALQLELGALMPKTARNNSVRVLLPGWISIVPMDSWAARTAFLNRYKDLVGRPAKEPSPLQVGEWE